MTREMLLTLGYEVICAKDGGEAIELFRRNADRIGLVLLNVVLPMLSGPEVYSQICAVRPGTRAIFVSGYSADNALLKSALQRGIGILQKPFSVSALGKAVRNALALKSPEE